MLFFGVTAGLTAAIVALVAWIALRLLTEFRRHTAATERDRLLALLTLLTPSVTAGAQDPRALITWRPIARAARKLFPMELSRLDQVWGREFPFGPEEIRDAHSRWTAEWLAWEGAHDVEYRTRTAALEQELGTEVNTASGRARLDALAREKLDRYQRRYEEYSRLSKALRTLADEGER